jgi:hypothetical protein
MFKTYPTDYDESVCLIGIQPEVANTYMKQAIPAGVYRIVDGSLERCTGDYRVLFNRPVDKDTEINPNDWPYPKEEFVPLII